MFVGQHFKAKIKQRDALDIRYNPGSRNTSNTADFILGGINDPLKCVTFVSDQ